MSLEKALSAHRGFVVFFDFRAGVAQWLFCQCLLDS